MNDLGPERMHVLWRDVDQHPIICIPIKDDFPKIDQLNGEQWTFVIKNVLLMEQELHLMLKECMRTLTTLLLCRGL